MVLKDKVAIITGAGRGIGKAYALRFAEEGAKVVISDINFDNAKAVVKEIGDQGALALKTDVSSEKDTKEMVNKTVERFGRVDVLVNNAAYMAEADMKPFTAISVEEWDRAMAVNVKGVFLCAKAVTPLMQSQGKGKIINISSGAVFMGMGFMLHYVSSKGAVIALTRSLAREIGEHGITVNCISPGFVPATATTQVSNMPALAEMVVEMQCFKRSEKPEDLVGTCVFLASDDSDFITGQTIEVDGGMVMH